MKLKQYSKYKSSGSDFFENIPVEWNISKLKFLISSLESGKRENIDLLTDDDNTVFSLGGEHINWNGTLNLKNKRFVSENYYNSMNNGKIAENDILLVKDGATIGKTAFVKNKPYSKMAVNEHVFIIRSNNKIESKLLYYLISSDIGFTQIKLTETGSAQGGINSEFISQVNFPLNYDKEEQTKISNFLDKKIEDMDSLIAKNKKLIQLLEEKRTSLINHVVTKGLDSNVKMKNSGIEWIGQIPEDWEVKRIKEIADVKISNVDKKSKENESEVLLCNYVDVYYNEFISSELNFMKATASNEQIKKLSLEKGDIILTKDSESPDDIAVPSLVDEKIDNLVCGYHLAVIRPNLSQINPYFLFKSFESRKINDQFFVAASGVTRFGISTYPIKNSFVLIPSIEEQKEISNYIMKNMATINKLIINIRNQETLLNEYKSSLVYNLVTGKISVR